MALRWVAVGVLAAVSVLWDIRTKRVPNVLTIGAALLALVHGGLGFGVDGLTSSALGWLIGLALFLPLFAVRGLGAGDVKLLAAFGAWLGPEGAVWAALWAALFGGGFAIVVSLAHGYLRQAVQNLGVTLALWHAVGLSAISGMTLRDSAGPRLAYAIPIAAGAVLALWRT